MDRKLAVIPIVLLVLIAGCSDKDARQSIYSLSTDIQLLRSSVTALRDAKVGYGDEKFKLENVAYHFSQDAFSPILNGQATVVAVNQKTLPALARVEVLYQVYTSDKTLLTSGMVPVSLASGRGEMALQIAIPVMIIDADNISIQLTPHRWYPVYLARPAL